MPIRAVYLREVSSKGSCCLAHLQFKRIGDRDRPQLNVTILARDLARSTEALLLVPNSSCVSAVRTRSAGAAISGNPWTIAP